MHVHFDCVELWTNEMQQSTKKRAFNAGISSQHKVAKLQQMEGTSMI